MSIQYHPLVAYMAAVAVAELVSWLIARLVGRAGFYLGHFDAFLYLGIGLTAVNWLVKNVLLLGFGVDLLSVPLF